MNHNILQKICDNLYFEYVYEARIYYYSHYSTKKIYRDKALFRYKNDAIKFLKKRFIKFMVGNLLSINGIWKGNTEKNAKCEEIFESNFNQPYLICMPIKECNEIKDFVFEMRENKLI